MSLSAFNRTTASLLCMWRPTLPAAPLGPTCLSAAQPKLKDELDNSAEEADDAFPKVAKLTHRFPESSNADGSLPPSPTEEPPSVMSAAARHALERETRQLIDSYFSVHLGGCKSEQGESKAAVTMRRVTEELLAKHQMAYDGMLKKLCIDQEDDNMNVIRVVSGKVFSDGVTNWGRVVSLMALGTVVCRHLKRTGREHCIGAVGHQIASYLMSEQCQWLLSNDGWEGFVSFFHVVDSEAAVRNTLVKIAGVAGIGAALAFLIR